MLSMWRTSHLEFSVADITLFEPSTMATEAREDHAVLDRDFDEIGRETAEGMMKKAKMERVGW